MIGVTMARSEKRLSSSGSDDVVEPPANDNARRLEKRLSCAWVFYFYFVIFLFMA